MTLVVAEGLHKGYGAGTARVAALDDVTLAIGEGEMVALTGPSGSGKTTLLHCLAGLALPDRGRVLLDGTDLAALSDDARSDLRSQRMGFVFQTMNLLPALTVQENVELPLVMGRPPARNVTTRAAAALEEAGLAGRAGAFPHELSGGEQQRAAVARATVGEPDVLWADEPTGALDTAAAEGVLALLRDAAAAGRTVVLVTHDDGVARAADRTIRLLDGRLA